MTIEEIKLKITEFRNLKYNWDGYGGDIPDEEALLNVLCFFEELPEEILDKLNNDDLAPTPYGTITCDWYKDIDDITNNFISIEIGIKHFGYFSLISYVAEDIYSMKINDENIQKIINILKNLYEL